eukprot:2699009-Rhodomonas_salina.1
MRRRRLRAPCNTLPPGPPYLSTARRIRVWGSGHTRAQYRTRHRAYPSSVPHTASGVPELSTENGIGLE